MLEAAAFQPLRHRHGAGAVVAHQHHVATRPQGGLGPLGKVTGAGGAGHAQVVGENHTAVAAVTAQHLAQPVAGKPRRLRVHRLITDMGRHDAVQTRCQGLERHQVVLQLFPGARVFRQLQMRIRRHMAVAGKVFAGGGHACAGHAVDKGAGQFGDRQRIGVKAAVADHAAGAEIQVQHRRETDVDVVGAQFVRHQFAEQIGGMAGGFGIAAVVTAQRRHRRQAGELGAEALHPTALLVHGDQQVRA